MQDKSTGYGEYMDRKRLALHLRTIRKSRGLSRADLAEKAGYGSPAMITAIESASKAPDFGKVKDLANALDVSIEQIKGFCKIEATPKGYAKLSESEKTALFLFAPIIKELPDEDIRTLLDLSLRLCQAHGRTPAWRSLKKKRDEEDV